MFSLLGMSFTSDNLPMCSLETKLHYVVEFFQVTNLIPESGEPPRPSDRATAGIVVNSRVSRVNETR